MCETWGRIRMRIGIMLMPIRIRIGTTLDVRKFFSLSDTKYIFLKGPPSKKAFVGTAPARSAPQRESCRCG
jgi:hypothetical protein